MNRKFKLILIPLLFAILLYIIFGNFSLEINEIKISTSKLPDSFNGFRIVQISDLHNAEFGKDNKMLLNKIQETEPDIIVITGDLIDSRHTDIEIGVSFAEQAQKIAPVYYVSGNHESRLSEYGDIVGRLCESGVTVLNNITVEIYRNEDVIKLSGIVDPGFYSLNNPEKPVKEMINNLNIDNNFFNILLSHRPETFDVYVESDIDIVFSGHAHGGQIRLPFIGGIVAPGQGLFPEFDSGVYIKNKTSMIVSRGLGNSLFPLRINNRPEIIVVEFNK